MNKSNKNKLKQDSKLFSKKNNIIDGKNISNLLEGPLKLLCEAVEENRNVIISLRNNHKMYAKVKAFDKHCNMLIYDIKELWTEKNWKDKTHKSQERYIAQSFLRGDNIIMIVKCPSKKKS
ncbi:related to small nuclear ribonucleoprotein chain D2 [Hanseniaspora guilliermondii]|uniref:Small nuclear ribonucleoprotein Sm D2 n=1 Tax=Hanseniaspora guilliermondii TaxID=56406 RepID=A0A1L0CK83_9ASCO|nr:related to small nuclear ribonucleoprotein chain D2 [Hanseniaspora guilliermondii]